MIAFKNKPLLSWHSLPECVGNRLKAGGMTTKFQNSRKFENAENLGSAKYETLSFSNWVNDQMFPDFHWVFVCMSQKKHLEQLLDLPTFLLL